jgi:hypothetical protein
MTSLLWIIGAALSGYLLGHWDRSHEVRRARASAETVRNLDEYESGYSHGFTAGKASLPPIHHHFCYVPPQTFAVLAAWKGRT